MVIRRIVNRLRAQDWAALVSELIIVVVGIFIAIQADRWWEQQDDLRQEKAYIARLAEDIRRDIDGVSYAIDLAALRLEFANLLITATREPEIAQDQPEKFLASVQQAAFTHTSALSSDTFEELRSTGNLGLLRNEALKAALFEYYRYDEGQRQYQSLQLMTEIRHFEFAANILSTEQHMWVQDNYYIFNPKTVLDVRYPDAGIEGVIETAQRLQESPDFIAWLPQARGIQLELIQTHKGRLKLAETLLSILEPPDNL